MAPQVGRSLLRASNGDPPGRLAVDVGNRARSTNFSVTWTWRSCGSPRPMQRGPITRTWCGTPVELQWTSGAPKRRAALVSGGGGFRAR